MTDWSRRAYTESGLVKGLLPSAPIGSGPEVRASVERERRAIIQRAHLTQAILKCRAERN